LILLLKIKTPRDFAMSDAYQKLIKTLRTVFEMDKAYLDFGIYRIRA